MQRRGGLGQHLLVCRIESSDQAGKERHSGGAAADQHVPPPLGDGNQHDPAITGIVATLHEAVTG